MAKDESIQEGMFAHITDWQKSDLSQKEWCRQHGIAYHIFHYWYRRFREQHTGPEDSSFVQLRVEPAEDAGCEIIFSNGTKLVFRKPVTSQYLKSLLF